MSRKAFSPANGTIFDQQLWGVEPTHKDKVTGAEYATSKGFWFQLNWSSPNGRFVGPMVTDQAVIKRLIPIVKR